MEGDLENILSGTEPAEIPAVEEPKGEIEQTPAPEPVAAPPAAEPHEEKVPLAALMAERKKRQELEARIKDMPAPPAPDFYANPEEYVNTVVAQRAVAMSIATAKSQFSDFDEVVAVFAEEAQNNPVLSSQLDAHPHPALFAYQQGQKLKKWREMQDPDAFEKSITEKVEARLRAEYEAKQKTSATLAASLPPDLSNARSARTAETQAHETIADILNSRKR